MGIWRILNSVEKISPATFGCNFFVEMVLNSISIKNNWSDCIFSFPNVVVVSHSSVDNINPWQWWHINIYFIHSISKIICEYLCFFNCNEYHVKLTTLTIIFELDLKKKTIILEHFLILYVFKQIITIKYFHLI